jgi:PKD repeat protein
MTPPFRRAISLAAFGRAARVGALSALIAIASVQSPHAEGEPIVVYVTHYDLWDWGVYGLGGLALMRPDGSHQVQLTSDSTDMEPAWSPDGYQIAFSRSSDIHVISAAGGTPTNLTNNPARDSSPAWSPDGERIAFVSTRGGPLELYLMNADGTGVARLTGNVTGTGRPAWSPDGSRIAFNCVIDTGNDDICAVSVDGATVTRLTADPRRDSDAAWSPDGRTIAFATERYDTIAVTEDGYTFLVAEIALMDPDGGGIRQLIAGVAAEYPSWSPDGAQIAFDTTYYYMYPAAPFVSVAVMNADGTGSVAYANARGGTAAWRPIAGNLAPVASFGAWCSQYTCHFDAGYSTDPDGSIANYDWDFGDGTTGSGVSASHTFATRNPYTVTLTVSDDSGATGSVSRIVELNTAPVAYGYVTCNGVTCNFNGSPSSDSDGTIATYLWEFGDGRSALGAIVTHTYSTPGIYLATLTVTDNEGATGMQVRGAIATTPPIPSYTLTCARLTCAFDGSASTDPDGSITSYEWYFGDGYTGTGSIASHTYPGSGTYYTALTVRDNLGISTFVAKHVTVTATLPPSARFTSSCTHLACVFDGSMSVAAEGTLTSHQWQFGDGTWGSGATASHTYAVAGTYSVLLTVRDSFGVANERRMNVTVTATPTHVGDMDAQSGGRGSTWTATVTIEIHGDNHERLANVRVTGVWSNGAAGVCYTSADGRCAMQLAGIAKQTRSLSFSVTSVSDGSGYRPERNHDPDRDSTGTTITVNRP